MTVSWSLIRAHDARNLRVVRSIPSARRIEVQASRLGARLTADLSHFCRWQAGLWHILLLIY